MQAPAEIGRRHIHAVLKGGGGNGREGGRGAGGGGGGSSRGKPATKVVYVILTRCVRKNNNSAESYVAPALRLYIKSGSGVKASVWHIFGKNPVGSS